MAHELPGRGACLALLSGTALLAACGYSGSPGAPGAGDGPRLSESITADLGWAPSSGSVDGYRVFEARDGRPFVATQDVDGPQVTVRGQEGETLRIQVAGLDASGAQGPVSEPSDLLRFEDDGVVAEPTSATAATSGAATRQVEGVPGAGQTSSSTAKASGAATIGDSGGSQADSGGSQADSGTSSPRRADDAAPASARADMDGDGASDLLWESSAGLLRVTSSDLGLLASFERPAAEWDLVGRADLDGDGLADLLWARETGELALSNLAVSLASQPALDFQPAGALGDRDLVVATGDFDGDGAAELLVQDSASGALGLGKVASRAAFEPQELDLALAVGEVVAGSRDYDGDGSDDLLLQADDGSLAVWLADAQGVRNLTLLAAGAGADVLASGDFDGDGVADVIRRNLAGDLEALLLGGGLDSPTSVTGLPDAMSLEPVGTGDYDGDGLSDLLWQDTAGTPIVWYANVELRAVEAVALGVEPSWTLVPDWR